MLKQFTDWLFSLVQAVFAALWDFVIDIVVKLLDQVLGAVVALVAMIPVPGFMAAGLQSVYSTLDGGVLYIANAVGIPQALALFGAAYLFRLARKVVTLFQW